MPAINIKSVVIILLLISKICTQSNSISVYEKRRHLKIYIQKQQYSIYLARFHRICFICTQKEDDVNNLEHFQQHKNKRANLNDHLRSARNLEDSNNGSNKRRRRSPYLLSVENLLTAIDSKIKKYLFGTEPQPRRKEWIYNNDKLQHKSVPHEGQVKSTPTAAKRKIRSTETVKEDPHKPATAPPTVTMNNPPSSVAATPYMTVPNSFNPFTPNNITETISMTNLPNGRSGSPFLATSSRFSTYDWSNYERTPLTQQNIAYAIDEFERKYYTATSAKLFSISPLDRRENGISFVESGLFLFLILSALSTDVDYETKAEIDYCLSLHSSNTEKINMVNRILEGLPPSSEALKFRWSMRLVLNNSWHLTNGAEKALPLQIDRLRGNETTEQLLQVLNSMVEHDSGGAMSNTFEEDELSEGARAVLVQTIYLRARWRSAPTLLNGTRPFRNADTAVPRTTRMLRINDIMRYADLTEWDAQAIEISYATPGLSLLVLAPRGQSLRPLCARAATTSLSAITARMKPLRVAVTLPIYTLRMTLLLPNKLQAMGISRLVAPNNDTTASELRLSHAVQRLMFWAEAGRNAFKDDGIEWNHKPDLEVMVDRPYLFYVRWRNLTLMNGNFVL